MTVKRTVAMILAAILTVVGLLCVAEANRLNEAVLQADLSMNEPLPGVGIVAAMIVGSFASVIGFVGVLCFLLATILEILLIFTLRGRLRLIPAGILLLGWIVISFI